MLLVTSEEADCGLGKDIKWGHKMTDYDAIIRVASLWLAQKLDDEIGVTLPQVDETSVPLVVMAAKLMEGKCSAYIPTTRILCGGAACLPGISALPWR